MLTGKSIVWSSYGVVRVGLGQVCGWCRQVGSSVPSVQRADECIGITVEVPMQDAVGDA